MAGVTTEGVSSSSGNESEALSEAPPPETPGLPFEAALDVLLQNTTEKTGVRLFRKKIEQMAYDALDDAKSIGEAALAPLAYAKSELQHANGVLGGVIADGEAEIARQQNRVAEAEKTVAAHLSVLQKLEALLG